MRTLLTWLTLAALIPCLCGCGEEDMPDSRLPPSKEDALELLGRMEEAIRTGRLDAAVDCMVLFPGMTLESAREELPKLATREGLTQASIRKLGAQARFGPLEEVFPERGLHWAEKAGVDPAYCVALSAKPAEVGIFWGGETLKVFRLDDLGKLR